MASGLGMPKDLEKLARELRRLGWVVEVTRGNHVRWANPATGFVTFTGLTPSSDAARRAMRTLRKAATTKTGD